MTSRQDAAASLRKVKVTFIIIGIIMIGIGFYKHMAYENDNSEYSYLYGNEDSVNAYVGGDAYNYIINGTYFTAYSILGMGSLIIATIAGVGAVLLSVEQPANVVIEKKEVSTISDIESNLPKM